MSPSSSRTGRRTLGALATAGALCTAMVAAAAPAVAAPARAGSSTEQPTVTPSVKKEPRGSRLGQPDREKLAKAVAAGTPRVTVMVVATTGQAARAKQEVRRLGGSVRYAADRYGYFSAVVPTGKVEQAAALASVGALDLDEVVPLPDARPDRPGKPSAPVTGGPSASTPDDNPFMPTRETGSTRFKQQHPTWDGRGVTIGVIDSGVDLAHPALQRTSTGQRKIVDTFTATDPVTEGSLVSGGDATWLRMSSSATGGSTTIGGETNTLPAGSYRFQVFKEAGTDRPGGELLGDVNRDGDKTDVFGVLLDQATNEVIVDSDDDNDLRNNPRMRPYGKGFQQGVFGTDKPATDVREALPFTVDVREDLSLAALGRPDLVSDFVDIGIVSGAHGSHVAGITAANDMFGGAMDGQAPGAQVVSARACSFGPGCTAAALTDGMAELAANRGVDIINMSIGGLPALNDGDNARAALYNKIIADGVQLVISAGNSGNALNTIGDPSVATDVLSVGASISRETWKANYGSDVSFARGMLTFSSGGPREDGGFKPNLTAPGSAISTTPTWQPGGPVAEAGYGLPAGYAMFNGTSMASPQAAGGMALMLSAAAQEGIAATSPAALRSAVTSTAVYDAEVPAFLQGHGELNVGAAYALLKRGLRPDAFTVSAPVCTEVWTILGRTTGTGLYNRCAAGAGGQAPGEARTYDVTVTRTTGNAKGSGTYSASLLGDDGTFRVAPAAFALPLGKPVVLKVTATPAAGAHSAVLRLDDSKTPGVDRTVMLAVAAGSPLAAPSFASTTSGTSERNEAIRTYVTVPKGAKALQLELGGLAAGTQTRFIAFHPFGLPVDSTSSLACYSNRGTDAACNSARRVYTDPQPGVWEVLVETRRTSPVAATPFTLTSTALGVTVDPAAQQVATATVGIGVPLSWTVRNDFGTVTGTGQGGSLGSALTDRPSIGDGAVQKRTVVVPEGAERLDVSIGSTSDAGADLDLYVTGPSGAKQAADGDSEEAVTYLKPLPGTYTIEIDGYDVPAGTTAYDYRDVFTSASLGSLEVTSPTTTLTSGQSTVVEGVLTAKQAVAEGRSLFGAMRYVSDGGALLGSGAVTVGAVEQPTG